LKKWMEEFWKSKPLPHSIGQINIFFPGKKKSI
jgi:hypothetical protein